MYQVTLFSLMSLQNDVAEKRPAEGRTATPPETRVDNKAAIRPCTWKRGITIKVRSEGVNS